MSWLGRHDTAALAAIGAAAMAANPVFAGHLEVLGVPALAAVGSAWLARQAALKTGRRVNTKDKSGFILPSDPPLLNKDGNVLTPAEGLCYGYSSSTGHAVVIPNEFAARHTAIIGSSGVGKTTLGEYLIWQQMCRGGGYMFIDAKLDFTTRNKLAMMAAMCGRPEDFYVLNTGDPSLSHTWNPLTYGDPDEVASCLMNLVPSTDNNPGADFYRSEATNGLSVLIGAAQAAKQMFNFDDLATLLQAEGALNDLLRRVPPGDARRTLELYLNRFQKRSMKGEVTLDMEKMKQNLGGITSKIQAFAANKNGQVMNTYTPEVDMFDIAMNNKFLYIMLPTMAKDAAALSVGKMAISNIRTTVARIQAVPEYTRPNPPFLAFLDEMGSYVSPGIARLFEQARSASISLCPAFQSFANLTALSPDFAEMVITNTWNKVFFKMGSATEAETAADILGKTTRYQRSVSVSDSSGESAQNLRTAPDGSSTDSSSIGEGFREMEEHLVTPDQLQSLGIGECIVKSGSNLFHTNPPRLTFPSANDYQPIRHRVPLPPDLTPMELKASYRKYLLKGGTGGDKSVDDAVGGMLG